VKLNGEKIKRFSITYDEIMEGGQLEFEMTSSISSVFYD
jgi:putative alpha-1,2-mannosidase